MVHTRSFGPTLGSDGAAMPKQSKSTDPIVLVNDEVVKISAILLQTRILNEVSKKSNVSEKVLEERVNNASEPSSPNSKVASGENPGDMSVMYICELSEIKGKFDPKKAAALGLRAGPKYRQLQLGQSVKSDREDIMVSARNIMKLCVA